MNKKILLPKETLLRMIENAPGSKIFNSLFCKDSETGEKQDICNDGQISCAFFVSGLLTLTGYLERPHATVDGFRKKLYEKGFTEVSSNAEVQPGDIVFWEKVLSRNLENEHVGFLLDKDTAVSTSVYQHAVVKHAVYLSDDVEKKERKITLILRTP